MSVVKDPTGRAGGKQAAFNKDGSAGKSCPDVAQFVPSGDEDTPSRINGGGDGGSIDLGCDATTRKAGNSGATLEHGPLRPHDQRGFRLLSLA